MDEQPEQWIMVVLALMLLYGVIIWGVFFH